MSGVAALLVGALVGLGALTVVLATRPLVLDPVFRRVHVIRQPVAGHQLLLVGEVQRRVADQLGQHGAEHIAVSTGAHRVIEGVDETTAREAFRLAAAKLSVQTQFVTRTVL